MECLAQRNKIKLIKILFFNDILINRVFIMPQKYVNILYIAFFHIDFVCDRFRCKSILFVNFQDVIIIIKLAIVAQNVSL